jgi:nucleoside-diphosphate-sugar epimerase
VERVSADALDPNQVVAVCKDADVVVHGVNVPYQRWTAEVPRIAANIRMAAENAHAILAFPGNVYPYGHPQQNPVREDHPIAPCTVKGRIRAEIERDYLAAHAAGKLRLVLPRYPDFYGPFVLNGLYSPIFDGALSGNPCRWPIDASRPHEFIHIDDAAQAMIKLVETPSAHGLVVHVPGPGTITGRDFAGLAYAAGGHTPKVRVFGRGLWRFAGLFNAEVRGAYEMAYLFQESLVLDGTRYRELVGSGYPATPYPEGVRRTVDWYRTPDRKALGTSRGR